MIGILVRAACLLLALAAFTTTPAAASAGSADALRIGVLAHRGKERALKDWRPHAEYLGRKLAPRRFEVVPLTLDEFPQAVAGRAIDLLVTNTGHYVELEAGGRVARIATMRVAGPLGPVDRLGGAAIVLAERQDLKGYADLRGKRIMVPDLHAFGGWQVHLPLAKAAGVDLHSDTREIIELLNHDQIVENVLAGKVDAGFVRTGLIESMAAAGKLNLSHLRVIGSRETPYFPYAHSTALYPEWPFARLDHVPEDLTKDILIALLGMPPGDPAARAAGLHSWTLPHNYQSVHDLFLEFRLGPYADLPVTFSDVLNRYGAPMLVGGIGIIALLAALLAMVASRNRALQQSQERLQLAAGVFAHAQEGIMITDADARIVDVNDTFLVLTGYRRDEVIGQNPNLLSSGKQDAAFYRRMWQELLEQGFWRGEMHNRRKDGREYIQQLSISAVRAPDGQISHFIGLSSDITQLKENEEKLVRMAYFDALTGLPNRRLLTDRLGQTLARAQRKESLLAICYLDLDGFKPVNDTWGHAVGDRVLVEAARRLSAAVRGGDTVSRLGGDEFVVLLADLVNFDECEAVIRRLLTAMATPFVLPAGEGHLSASIGVTLYPVDDADPDMLIRHADHAMYVAKQAGRNQFHLFDVARDA